MFTLNLLVFIPIALFCQWAPLRKAWLPLLHPVPPGTDETPPRPFFLGPVPSQPLLLWEMPQSLPPKNVLSKQTRLMREWHAQSHTCDSTGFSHKPFCWPSALLPGIWQGCLLSVLSSEVGSFVLFWSRAQRKELQLLQAIVSCQGLPLLHEVLKKKGSLELLVLKGTTLA